MRHALRIHVQSPGVLTSTSAIATLDTSRHQPSILIFRAILATTTTSHIDMSTPSARGAVLSCCGCHGRRNMSAMLGLYVLGGGQPTCQVRPANSNSPPESALLTECSCNAGATEPDGATCVLGLMGEYKASSGSAACSDCPVNSIFPSGSSLLTSCQCNAGYTGIRRPCDLLIYDDSFISNLC
jgi:hypothetical protein